MRGEPAPGGNRGKRTHDIPRPRGNERGVDRTQAAGIDKGAHFLAVGIEEIGGGPKAFLLGGDAKRAEVGYGADPATTLPLAKAHCAAYERVPRLLQAQENIAYYECYKP